MEFRLDQYATSEYLVTPCGGYEVRRVEEIDAETYDQMPESMRHCVLLGSYEHMSHEAFMRRYTRWVDNEKYVAGVLWALWILLLLAMGEKGLAALIAVIGGWAIIVFRESILRRRVLWDDVKGRLEICFDVPEKKAYFVDIKTVIIHNPSRQCFVTKRYLAKYKQALLAPDGSLRINVVKRENLMGYLPNVRIYEMLH